MYEPIYTKNIFYANIILGIIYMLFSLIISVYFPEVPLDIYIFFFKLNGSFLIYMVIIILILFFIQQKIKLQEFRTLFTFSLQIITLFILMLSGFIFYLILDYFFIGGELLGNNPTHYVMQIIFCIFLLFLIFKAFVSSYNLYDTLIQKL